MVIYYYWRTFFFFNPPHIVTTFIYYNYQFVHIIIIISSTTTTILFYYYYFFCYYCQQVIVCWSINSAQWWRGRLGSSLQNSCAPAKFTGSVAHCENGIHDISTNSSRCLKKQKCSCVCYTVDRASRWRQGGKIYHKIVTQGTVI